jgi:hypothetical protein
LTLFERTGDEIFLHRAIQAGDDCCQAQTPSGNFRNSSFQQGPMEGGTPHEAAVDVGLLALADALQSQNAERAAIYFETAEKNIQQYYMGRLWNGNGFLDQPWNNILVPNKNATIIEALLLYEKLGGQVADQVLIRAGDIILNAQVNADGPFDGGIVHQGTGKYQLRVGVYTARCAPATIKLYERFRHPKYLSAAQNMGRFLMKLIATDGTYFGVYPDERVIVSPTWISPSGDFLRAFFCLRDYLDVPESIISDIISFLDIYQTPSGGIATAHNLNRKGDIARKLAPPNFIDLLPVVGWCDKALWGLALYLEDHCLLKASDEPIAETVRECTWKQLQCLYQEDDRQIQLIDMTRDSLLYHWRKGQDYPEVFVL